MLEAAPVNTCAGLHRMIHTIRAILMPESAVSMGMSNDAQNKFVHEEVKC